ncbi:18724_t:CDS:2, partial [Dentiscutata erythropus]
WQSKILHFALLYYFFVPVILSACDYTTKCKCPQPRMHFHKVNTVVAILDHAILLMLQCNPQGGGCEYGYRNSCARCGKLNCASTPHQLVNLWACSSDTDCCKGVCDYGYCVTCRDFGRPCQKASDCCNGNVLT